MTRLTQHQFATANLLPPIQIYELPDSALLDVDDVIGRPPRNGCPGRRGLLPMSKVTLWRHITDGKFPRPTSNAGGRRRWSVKVIRELLEGAES